jgi:hypothetical protein
MRKISLSDPTTTCYNNMLRVRVSIRAQRASVDALSQSWTEPCTSATPHHEECVEFACSDVHLGGLLACVALNLELICTAFV